MNLCALFIVACVVQLVQSAPSSDDLHNVLRALDRDEVEELVEILLEGHEKKEQNNKLDLASRKRELLEDSARLADAVLQAEREASLNNEMSGAKRMIRGYGESTSYVQRISKVARKQLNAIAQFKRDWEAVYGPNGNKDEFWRVVKSNKFLSPSTCEVDDDACITATTRTLDVCPLPDPSCDRADRPKFAKYRTIDGSCNNPEVGRRDWGMAMSAQARILDAIYEDGLNSPRVTGKSTAVLPNARSVSMEINIPQFLHSPSTRMSYMMMQFGQWLDHDLSFTDTAMTDEGNDIGCSCGLDPASPGFQECYNIEVPAGDYMTQDCIKFTRSAPWMTSGCENNVRQQVNSITSYLDCSQVYGSDKRLNNNLRDQTDLTRGKMATIAHPTHPEWKDLLPILSNRDQRNDCAVQDFNCFLAGDKRRNVQPGLIAMHTVWVRMHNYIEENLHAKVPAWDGDTLYEESRRILIAITQHMVYNEYLEALIGRSAMREERSEWNNLALEVNADSLVYNNIYDNTKHAGISNIFSTAAYRFGHSEINKYLKFLSQFVTPGDRDCDNVPQQPNDPLPYCERMRDHYNNPTSIYVSPAGVDVPGVDAVLKGIIKDPAERVDQWYTEEIFDFLFTEEPEDSTHYGLDLFALNIQRGRDHGLPGYMEWRAHYGLSTANFWDPPFADISETRWALLREAYPGDLRPDDIDVYAGGLVEESHNGAKIGDLFKAVIVEQFMKLKVADRFWYEHGDEAWSFTLDQLTEIRKFTFSGLLCATLDDPGELPMNPFNFWDAEDGENPLMPCAQNAAPGQTPHPEINFDHWIPV